MPATFLGVVVRNLKRAAMAVTLAGSAVALPAVPALASGYGPGAVYEIELSANAAGPEGGGLWLWIALYPDGTGDYSGADCGHGRAGAAHESGDVTWTDSGGTLIITGVTLNGLGGFPTTVTVPDRYGHYTGTLGSFETLPDFIPPFIGKAQLQVAP